MAFLVSPGVQVQETDITNVVPAVSSSLGGYAGPFAWGPIEEFVTVTSEKELADQFGKPTEATARSFLTAASFLLYGNDLKVVRAAGSAAKNATSGDSASNGLLIKNKTAYETSYATGQASVGVFGAKYAGTFGNDLGVSVCSAGGGFATWYVNGSNANDGLWSQNFNSAPGTSSFAAAAGSEDDELHIVVYDATGGITGVQYSVLEVFPFVSQASDAVKEDGTSNYYVNVINGNSKYVWWLDHPSSTNGGNAFDDAGTSAYDTASYTAPSTGLNYTLSGGVDSAPTAGDITAALDVLADAEIVDVNLLFASVDADGEATIAQYIATIAETRKDCMAFISPPIENSVGTTTPSADVLSWYNSDFNTASSYIVKDNTAAKVYDKYNDVYRWIPLSGHVAGLCANTDYVADAWFSPAGYNRGRLRGITKLAWNANQAARDALYKASINAIVSFPGEGTILFGDKTGLLKPSAFGHIGVRRLFIVLEKAISTASKYQLFEFNDEFTQAMFRNMTEPYLRDVQGRRGIIEFKVVCDSTNNTPEVIDRNEFRGDIYIKPSRSINAITLNFIATRTGVSFSELVGSNN